MALLGGVALLEEVCHCGRGFKVSKAQVSSLTATCGSRCRTISSFSDKNKWEEASESEAISPYSTFSSDGSELQMLVTVHKSILLSYFKQLLKVIAETPPNRIHQILCSFY